GLCGEGNPQSEQEKEGGPAPPHQGTLITAKRESDFFVLGWGSLVVLGGRRMRTGRGCVMRCVGWLIGSRARGMKSRSRRRRFPAPMHERLLRCFENNVDLVFSHRSDDPQSERRVVDDLIHSVGVLRAVLRSVGDVLPGELLLERNYHPFMWRARSGRRSGARGCGTERVISAAGVAAYSRDLCADHGQHSVSEQHLAGGAERVDLSPAFVRPHFKSPLSLRWPGL